jgi:autotransporter-associated beta strand protein
VVFNGVIAGTGSDALTKAGTGSLTLGGANTYSGPTNVSAGTLAFGASNSLNNASLLTVASSATLSLGTTSQTVGSVAGSGTIAFGSGGALTLSGGSGTFSGTLTGSGTFTINSGASLTLGTSFNTPSVNLTLAGGTLFLNGTNSTFGTFSLSGNSIIDFASPSSTTLDVSNLNLNGFTLTVDNWTDGTDYFYAQTFTGATQNTSGAPPMDQVYFSGYSNLNTEWKSYDLQVTPTPEPAAYGALFTALSLAAAGAARLRRNRARA